MLTLSGVHSWSPEVIFVLARRFSFIGVWGWTDKVFFFFYFLFLWSTSWTPFLWARSMWRRTFIVGSMWTRGFLPPRVV